MHLQVCSKFSSTFCLPFTKSNPPSSDETRKFVGVGKVQGAGAGWTGGKVRSLECKVRRAVGG